MTQFCTYVYEEDPPLLKDVPPGEEDKLRW
jgi:hypothetical protein